MRDELREAVVDLLACIDDPKDGGIGAMVEAMEEVMDQCSPFLVEPIYTAADLEAAVAREREAKDGAYHERDQLVTVLSKLFPSHLMRHPDADMSWENDWRWIVCISLPTGQATWHIHDSERGMFDHLDVESNDWDGHTTPEKYERLAAIRAEPSADGWQADAKREVTNAQDAHARIAALTEALTEAEENLMLYYRASGKRWVSGYVSAAAEKIGMALRTPVDALGGRRGRIA